MAWNEQQRAALSQKRGRAAATIADPQRRQAFISQQGQAEQSGAPSDEAYLGMDREAENALALPEQTPPPQQQPQTPSYRRGTPFVKKTGLAKLHRGEAVVPRKKATAMRRGRSAFFGG
jgi:hypothetical protein